MEANFDTCEEEIKENTHIVEKEIVFQRFVQMIKNKGIKIEEI
jgi:hypothetical protein